MNPFNCLFMLWFVLLILKVKNVTGDTADTFLEYIQRNIPEGVSMSVEQTALEPLPEFFELPAEAKAFLDEQKTQSEKNDKSAIEQWVITVLKEASTVPASFLLQLHASFRGTEVLHVRQIWKWGDFSPLFMQFSSQCLLFVVKIQDFFVPLSFYRERGLDGSWESWMKPRNGGHFAGRCIPCDVIKVYTKQIKWKKCLVQW